MELLLSPNITATPRPRPVARVRSARVSALRTRGSRAPSRRARRQNPAIDTRIERERFVDCARFSLPVLSMYDEPTRSRSRGLGVHRYAASRPVSRDTLECTYCTRGTRHLIASNRRVTTGTTRLSHSTRRLRSPRRLSRRSASARAWRAVASAPRDSIVQTRDPTRTRQSAL
jgi:hypothetical protein